MGGTEHRTIRVLLLVGVFAGLTTYLFTPLERPEQLMLATDVYQHAVGAYIEGGPLYDNPPPGRSGYNYLYPPITVLVFIPHAILGSLTAAFVLQTGLNLLASVGTGVIIYRALERRELGVSRFDLALILAFLLLSPYGAIQFLNGQINLWLAFALALGFDAMDRNRHSLAGSAFAIAALFKVFPAILGLWLLRLRAWRAIGAAVATGLGGLLLGAIVFGPELTVTYLNDVLLDRFGGATYDGRPAPDDSVDGVHRQLAAFWPDGAVYHSVVGLVIVGTVLAGAMIDVSERTNRDAAALATIVAILLYLPLQPLYFPLITFPLFMLLYSELADVARRLLILGTVLTVIHIQQQAVEMWFDIVPAPATVTEPVQAATATLFTVILPPTLGLWILLVACVVIQFEGSDLPKRQPSPTSMPA